MLSDWERHPPARNTANPSVIDPVNDGAGNRCRGIGSGMAYGPCAEVVGTR